MRKRKRKESGTEETISEGGNDITEKEKFLLYQDLCARIPYGPKCECEFAEPAKNGYAGCIETLTTSLVEAFEEIGVCKNPYKRIRPYLRPLTSMTKEEEDVFAEFDCYNSDRGGLFLSCNNSQETIVHTVDLLNALHFDHHGLISLKLAVEAPKGMYEHLISAILEQFRARINE